MLQWHLQDPALVKSLAPVQTCITLPDRQSRCGSGTAASKISPEGDTVLYTSALASLFVNCLSLMFVPSALPDLQGRRTPGCW